MKPLLHEILIIIHVSSAQCSQLLSHILIPAVYEQTILKTWGIDYNNTLLLVFMSI